MEFIKYQNRKYVTKIQLSPSYLNLLEKTNDKKTRDSEQMKKCLKRRSVSKIVKRVSQNIKNLSAVLNNCSFHCDKFTISSSDYEIEIKWLTKSKTNFIKSKS